MDRLLVINIALMGFTLTVADSPVAAILAVIAIFASVSGLLALNGCGTIALFVLIIYIGAIAILFLFITFLLNLRKIQAEKGVYRTIRYVSAGIISIVMGISLISKELVEYPDYTDVGTLLEDQGNLSVYTVIYNSSTFWIIGLLLLVALIGVILLTKSVKKERKLQSTHF